MSTSSDRPPAEHSSTYFVQNRQSEQELARLAVQDRIITTLMGGVWPEQSNPSRFRRVLDIGCGSGNWAIEVARTYPELTVFGIDISRRMVAYAREQAAQQQLEARLEFHVMDALLMLEFPDDYFDLVNLRLGVSFMRTWDWPKLLREMARITRQGGVLRLTDNEIVHESNSLALTRISAMVRCALFRAGHLFADEDTGLTGHLAELLTRHGCQDVQTRIYALEIQGGTPAGEAYYQDAARAGLTLRPFVEKWGCASDDYDALYQESLADMQQSTFRSTWRFLTAWGTRA